jgi:hypothetical protein
MVFAVLAGGLMVWMMLAFASRIAHAKASFGISDATALIAEISVGVALMASGSRRWVTKISAPSRLIRHTSYVFFVVPVRTRTLRFKDLKAVDIAADGGIKTSGGLGAQDMIGDSGGMLRDWFLFGSSGIGVHILAWLFAAGGASKILLVTQDRDELLIHRSHSERATAALATEVSKMTGARLT